jgi:hypothetical protein
MRVDRRELLAGLGATAATPAPAWPASAGLSHLSAFAPTRAGVRRLDFVDGPIFSMNWLACPPDNGSFILDAVWHFDWDADYRWLIRHVPSGLTCRQKPQDNDGLALQAVSLETSLANMPDAAEIAAIGRAARSIAFDLFCFVRHLPNPYKAPVFVSFPPAGSKARFWHPRIEPAPRLS